MIVIFYDDAGAIGRWITRDARPPRVGDHYEREVPHWIYVVTRVVWHDSNRASVYCERELQP
jgi:hypothetical protein